LQDSGVQLTDGDGTVPLLSMGALCAGGWRTKRLNPGGSKVVVREYMNDPWPVYKDPR
jgi:phospholipid:diacylglycerol acyltransferase